MHPAHFPSTGIPVGSGTVRTIEHPGWMESQITIPEPADETDLRDVLGKLPDGGAETVVGVDLFGTHEQVARMEKSVRQAGVAAPVTSVLSTSSRGGGIQMAAASGVERTPLFLEGEIVGYLLEDAEARYCILGGIKPGDAQSPRARQTEDVFSSIEKALALAGMGFEHVVRTWFYNEKILEWYSTFNSVRTGYFARHAIRRMPASTGIGAPNPARTALVAKAVAVRPAAGGAGIRTVRSPMQCDAFAYGSAFSRALEVADSRSRTLSISGTASIEPGGRSIHQGDPAGQIELTMDVVRGILDEAGMKFEEVTRGLAYFRDPAHIPLWEDYCRRRLLPPLPVLAVGCCVCRDDLLFEIEFDASAPTGFSRAG
ncbi:MAG: RidA family protein [Verrucomicrobiae bacterium]